MKILAITSGKGGSCKSTTALSLAAILSERFKVLIVDSDPQASLSWIADRSEAQFDVMSETQPEILSRLRKVGGYDFILCDTPPALASEVLETTVKLSDFAVLPSPISPLDIRELSKTIQTVIKPIEKPYRVLLARVDSRRLNEAFTIQSQLMEKDIPVFNGVIRANIAHERAVVDGKLITQYTGKRFKEASEDYRRVTDELLRELEV
jgi:chromosome partitioning protein